MLYAIVAVLILILDQGLKYWTAMHVPVGTGLKEFIPGFLQLRNVHNSGSAFSLLNNWPYARWLFLGVTVVFAILVILALRNRWIKGGFGRWMALFVLAGALGNGIDRCLYGYVVDMLEFAFKIPLIGSFPVFNVADVFITCGAIAFCLYVLLHKEHAEEAKAYGHVRRGPGGSVVSRPAPKPKPKPEPKPAEDEPTVREAPRGRREAPRASRNEVRRESFTEETKRRPGEDPFSEWMNSAEIRSEEEPQPVRESLVKPAAAAKEAPQTAREVAAEAPRAAAQPVTLDIPEHTARQSGFKAPSGPVTLDIPETAARENPFKSQNGPVTLDIPAARPVVSENPFKAPSGPVTLDIPAARPAVSEDPFKASSGPVTLDVPAAQRPAAPERPAAPQRPSAPNPEPVKLDVAKDDDEEFTLEDILNEFRDL